MFALLLGHCLCDWHTSNIGKPLLSLQSGQYIVTSTNAGFVALLNESDGHLFWRTRLSGVRSLEMREGSPVIVALQKHYFIVIDNETGFQTSQIPHNVKHSYSASFANRTVVIAGPKKLALYNITHEIWSVETEQEEEATVRFTDDGSKILLAGKEFDPATGAVLGEYKAEETKKVVDFRYTPTLLEYYRDGEFVWRLDEPFYGAEIVGVLSYTHSLFKNATGLVFLNMNKGEIQKFMPMHVISAVVYEDFTYIRNDDGDFKLDNKKLELGPIENEIVHSKQFNHSISTGKSITTIPANGEVMCTLQSPTDGNIFTVYKQGHDLGALIIKENGGILTNAYMATSDFGHCWMTKDSFHVSYIKHNGHPYVNSFSQNISAQRSWETDDVIITSSEHYALYANGRLENIPTNQLSATMPMPEGENPAGGAMSMFKTMMSGEITAGPAFYEPHLHAVNAQRDIFGYDQIADGHQRVVLKGVDVFLIGEQVTDRTMHYLFVGLFLFAAIYMGILHYKAEKVSFWK